MEESYNDCFHDVPLSEYQESRVTIGYETEMYEMLEDNSCPDLDDEALVKKQIDEIKKAKNAPKYMPASSF